MLRPLEAPPLMPHGRGRLHGAGRRELDRRLTCACSGAIATWHRTRPTAHQPLGRSSRDPWSPDEPAGRQRSRVVRRLAAGPSFVQRHSLRPKLFRAGVTFRGADFATPSRPRFLEAPRRRGTPVETSARRSPGSGRLRADPIRRVRFGLDIDPFHSASSRTLRL